MADLIVTYPELYIQRIYNPDTNLRSYKVVTPRTLQIGGGFTKTFSGLGAFTRAKAYKAEITGEALPQGFTKKTFKSLGEDFPKFFKEYLDKKSKMEIGGSLKGTKHWSWIEKALATLPKNASLEDKWNVIRDFNVPGTQLEEGKKIGTNLTTTIKDTFNRYQKGANTIGLRVLHKLMPRGYGYVSLVNMFGIAKLDQSKYTGKRKKHIQISRNFVKNLEDLGLKQIEGSGGGKPYLFKKPSSDLVKKLGDIAIVSASQSKTLRQAITKFSKASDDYRKFGFAKSAGALEEAADNLNKVLMDTFTDRNLPRQKGGEYSARFLRNVNRLDKAISKTNASRLRNFINDNPDLRTKLELSFDVEGVNTGNYFKTRNLSKLSAGQLLRDLTIEKDHIFPYSAVEKTAGGKFGKGAVLSESAYNKALSASYVNNSLRNNIQNF